MLEIIVQKIFNVLATYGDSHLGGDDFDKKIMNYCLKDIKIMNRLKVAAEKAKIK